MTFQDFHDHFYGVGLLIIQIQKQGQESEDIGVSGVILCKNICHLKEGIEIDLVVVPVVDCLDVFEGPHLEDDQAETEDFILVDFGGLEVFLVGIFEMVEEALRDENGTLLLNSPLDDVYEAGLLELVDENEVFSLVLSNVVLPEVSVDDVVFLQTLEGLEDVHAQFE